MSMRDILGRIFDPKGKAVARAVDGGGDITPAAPLTPEGGVSIIQTETVGGHAWQLRQLQEAEQRLDAKAARAGAKARMNVERAIREGRLDEDGAPAFGMTASGHLVDVQGREMRAALDTTYLDSEHRPTTPDADAALTALPDGLAPEMAAYKLRERDGRPRHVVTSFISQEEKARRIALEEAEGPITARVRYVELLALATVEDLEKMLKERLAANGATIHRGHIEYDMDYATHDRIAVWKP